MMSRLSLSPLGLGDLLSASVAGDPVHVLADVVDALAPNDMALAVSVPEQSAPGVKLHVTFPTRHLWTSDIVVAIADDEFLVEDLTVFEGAI